MYDHNGETMSSLQLAQERQELGDFAGVVLISAVKSNQGIENQQLRLESSDDVFEPLPVALLIQSQAGRRDDVDRDRLEVEAAVSAQACEPVTHCRRWILGEIDQHLARLGHRKGVETRRASRHREREIECEERLAQLGMAGHEAHGLVTPE
jgi:hypothetical protein